MVERALRAAGVTTGRYTSPHLSALEERFALDGRSVAPPVLDTALERVRQAAASLASPPTFFEATTAAALEIFRDARVQVAVLEVGLGGRLDATNVVGPAAAAITSVDFDHTAQLGARLEDIAREKAGIMRADIPVVLAENPPEVRDAVRAAATAAGARLFDVSEDSRVTGELDHGQAVITLETPRGCYDRVRLGLRGRHQIANALTAVRLLEEFGASAAVSIPPDAVRTGLEAAVWPARLELLSWRGQPVLLDGAHNPGGARALAAYVQETYGRRLPFVLAVMRDKAVDEMLAALGQVASHIVATAPDSDRALRADELASRVRERLPAMPLERADDPADALARAALRGSPVVVAGSLYLAGEIRPLLS